MLLFCSLHRRNMGKIGSILIGAKICIDLRSWYRLQMLQYLRRCRPLPAADMVEVSEHVEVNVLKQFRWIHVFLAAKAGAGAGAAVFVVSRSFSPSSRRRRRFCGRVLLPAWMSLDQSLLPPPK